jgi:hypothetical protein
MYYWPQGICEKMLADFVIADRIEMHDRKHAEHITHLGVGLEVSAPLVPEMVDLMAVTEAPSR